MNARNRYLEAVARLRARTRKLSLTQRRIIVASIMFVLLVVILSIEISPFGSLVDEGRPSPRTILAPRTVQYVDQAKTREAQDAAAAAVEDTFVMEPAVVGEAMSDVRDIFDVAEAVSSLPVDSQQKAQEAAARVKNKAFTTDISTLVALNADQRQLARDAVIQAVSRVMAKGFSKEGQSAAVEDVKSAVGELVKDAQVRAAAEPIAALALRPNETIDAKETARRRQAARDAVKPIITTKLQGEVIVNKGEIVTSAVVQELKSLGFRSPTFTALNLLFVAVFVFLLIVVMGMYLARFRRMYYDSPGLLVLVGSTVVIYAAVAKVLTVAASSWAPFWGYLMPTAAVAIIIAVLFESGTALVTVAICALITGVVTGGNFSLVALALLGGILPSLYASRSSTRHELRRVGLYTAFWVAAVAFGATVLTPTRQGMLLNTGIGFINGAVCTVIAMGSLPFLETTFRVTTNTWLLELASPDQELLKELSMKAPGTYSHSVMVANLAEAAAREIGSDPMLARVTAYYHDIGKVKRPQFFVENQPPGENPHENLSPTLSLIIITSHVKDGVEMMEKAHIPPDIVDIVKEHHGTSVVRYFYEQALESGEPIDIETFRYHSDKPRRRTAGILMLADSVEATARTLKKPSATSIEQMVDRIVDGKLKDGQLDECQLTFKELNGIRSTFSKVLIGTYHPRIDYNVSEGEKAIAGRGKRSGARTRKGVSAP
jgi:cyclic-di-AMP phosphodiesterase PgpH